MLVSSFLLYSQFKQDTVTAAVISSDICAVPAVMGCLLGMW